MFRLLEKPFVAQLCDVVWQLDGHHPNLAVQQCAVHHWLSLNSKATTLLIATSRRDQTLSGTTLL